MIAINTAPPMAPMHAADHLDLDGHALALLIAVAEEGSVTRAALRLNCTQSSVSHGLDRLRAITGDALFVRSGRGIVPSARLERLLPQARELLARMQSFAGAAGFDPAGFAGSITVAANDLQREVLLPALFQRLRAQAPGMGLRVIPSGVPVPELLRDGACQLLLTPRPPEASDLMQKRLFDDVWQTFYDPTQRQPPAGLNGWLAAEHATVVYEPRRLLAIDRWLDEQGMHRRFAVTVPGFGALSAFVCGSSLLATAPARLAGSLLQGLAAVAPPLPCPPLAMYAVWHARHQDDPMHRWLRETLDTVARALPPVAPAPQPLGLPAA